MIIYSTLFLFNNIPNFCARRQIFIQLVRFLFNNFCCPIWSADKQSDKKMAAMAATMEVKLEDVLSCIDNLLMETEIQDNNSDLGFHEEALVLYRLEMVVSVLRAIVDIELDLDTGDVGQVLGELCGLVTDIYQYWGAKVSQMRRRTASLPDFGLCETIHSANPGSLLRIVPLRRTVNQIITLHFRLYQQVINGGKPYVLPRNRGCI